MKRVKWLLLLCAFVFAFTPCAWTATLEETANARKTEFEEAYDTETGKVGWTPLIRAIYAYESCDTKPQELTSYYAGIKKLDLSGESITDSNYDGTDIGSLAPFTGLEELNLSNTNITNIGGLSGMTALKSLDLSGNKLEDIGALANKTTIESLDISNTGATHAWYGALVGMSSLKKLDISRNPQITSIGPLTKNETTNQFAEKLEELNISETGLAVIQEVWGTNASSLPNLKTLYARNLNLTSISGLVMIVNVSNFNPTGITWNLGNSTLTQDGDNNSHVNTITNKFSSNASGFTAPTVEASPKTRNAITINDASQAMIVASNTTAREGDTVTVTIAESYKGFVTALHVVNGESEVTTTSSESGFTFTMPASDVTLSADITKKDTLTQAPQTKTGLVYTGETQELITAGTVEAEADTLQYAVTTDTAEPTEYTTEIPTGTGAGTYHVWYKVAKSPTTKSIKYYDNRYNSVSATKIDVAIAKADLTVNAPTGLTSTYGKTLADVTLPTADNGTWAWSDATTTSVGNAGTNTFKAQFTPSDTENYDTPAAVDVSITVAKAKATVDTAPTAKTSLTYTGSAQALVEAGKATGGTLQYAVGTTAGTYSSEIPTGTDAGSYTVWYQVIGDNNHENFTAKSLTVTIAKAPASEITTQVGGTTTGTATTTNGKTNTKTSKTTTFTLGSGTGASTMSADVAITTEEKLEAQAGSEFSTVVAVDTTLTGNKDFNQYAYSMDIVGLPSWLTKTGELTSSDANADTAGKYHHEFTLSGTPTEVLADGKITFTALITLSGDNYANALKASADKSVEVTVTARPVPPVAPVLRIVDASEDKSLIITADVTDGSVTLSPDVVVEATAGTNFVWIVSGDLPKYLTATSTDKTLTISGYISDDLIAYSIVVIASNDVGSDSVKISFNVYKTETDESGAVTVTITSEDIEKIKETKGSDELTLSDIVDTTALNETLASSGGALKLSNGLTTLEGISDLSNLKTLDITEVATLTTKSLTADSLGSATEIKIGENNTSITTVDLSGSKVETVTMQKSSVQTLTLGSSVKTVDAKDSATLKAIDFSQSTNVQTVNISGTQVASADLSNCTELVSFSFDVEPGNGTNSAGALQTLKLPETSDKLENLAVRGNQLLWLSLGSSKYPNLKNVNVRGQRRGGASIKMAFDFLEFLWNLYQQSLHENEADYEEYTEGAETPFDVAQISSDITYVASDDNSTQTATVTDGKVSFARTPKNFKYEYDTGFRRSGRTASAGSFITAEDEDEENGNMDVTIETGSVTGSAGRIASSSGGGCDAGFGYGALSALILVFATLKKRR